MKKTRYKLGLFFISIFISFNSFAGSSLLKNPDVQKFISEVANEGGYTREELEAIFSKVVRKDRVLEIMQKPAEKHMKWWEYRALFLNTKRINEGVAFWKENRLALEKAHKKYGVSPEAVIGILGIETGFGQHRGGYRIIDALSTLAFFYPKRSKFFTSELKAFLELSRKQGFDPLELDGSYAGAMGIPQFMPSSYLAYAVDLDGDGKVDIWHSPTDAIGSVAAYLGRHGWKDGKLVASEAMVSGNAFNRVLTDNPKPKFAMSEARKLGWQPKDQILAVEKVRGLQLEGKRAIEYWLTMDNFYVITRYNRSDLYAMAVYQLGHAVHEQYLRENPEKN